MAASAPALGARSPRRTYREAKKILIGLLFISPWIVGFLWLTLYPMGASLYYSFTEYQILDQPRFVGLENFRTMLFRDRLFWVSVGNTLWYAVVSLPLGTVCGIVLAWLLNHKVRFMSIYRTIYYVPTVVPTVAAVMLWVWMLNPKVGLVNTLLGYVGIQGPGWLGDPRWAKPALVILGLWGLGGGVVIYLAGLQDIPVQLYEAASLDGANAAQMLLLVTIPLLTPTILFNVVMGLIGAFQYFAQAMVAGSFGGPLDSLLFYNLYLYRNAFGYFKMGYASGMAWLLLVFALAVTLAIFSTTGRWVQYGR